MRGRGGIGAALWSMPWLVLAVEPAAVAAATPPPAPVASMASQLIQLLLGLGAVLALIFFLAWLLRRVQQASPRSGQAIEIISSRALGTRDRLVLVQVGSEQILLGLTPGRITPLHVLKEPVAPPAKTEQATPEFAQRLMELLGKDHKDTK
jgi:flagellar protein FliO/FliZ